MICETCIGVLQHRRHVLKTWTNEISSGAIGSNVICGHHLTCESLGAAAANGCPICQPTWESLSASQQDLLRAFEANNSADAITTDPSSFVTLAHLSDQLSPEDLSFRILYNSKQLVELTQVNGDFVLEKQRDTSSSHHTAIHASYQTTSTYAQNSPTEEKLTTDHTSSAASLQMAGMWLRDCIRSHQQCSTYQRDNPWYPTRLLHLPGSHGSETYVGLIRTAEQPPDGPYATLSHRWGNYKPLQLTWSMASNPNHSFSIDDMPKTFQEAIKVSRILGIRYLWIDSLCIIQEGDNLRDWYHEAGLMDKVYKHSHLNIYAADAVDSTKGLFRHHPPLPVGRQHVTVNVKVIETGSELVDCLVTDRLLLSRNLENSPLNNRGWVLQERYLAPRVLYFCQSQLFWECKEHVACETIPDGLPDWKVSAIKPWEKSVQSASGAQSQKRWMSFWDLAIVPAYTAMNLTVPSDKLIALSGIAKHFMAYLNQAYVAGMWRSRLEVSLLWSVSPKSLQPRPLVYRAPSWSWASVDGPVYPSVYSYDQSRIQVVDVVLSHATEDTTGAVTEGWLDLRGVLKPLRLCESKESVRTLRMVLDNATISPQHDTIEEGAWRRTTIHLDFLPVSNYLQHDDNVQGRLFYMPCSLRDEPQQVMCLLFKLVDKDKTLFERFGVSWTYEPTEKEQLLADLGEDTKAHLPCLHYENGLHTIRII